MAVASKLTATAATSDRIAVFTNTNKPRKTKRMRVNIKKLSKLRNHAWHTRFAAVILISSLLLSAPLLGYSKLYAADKKQVEFAADNPPYLEDFVISSEDDKISLSLSVANPFDLEIKSLLLNGVSQKISLNVEVSVNSFNLYLVKFDRTLSDNTYIHNIDYDNLKKVFTITISPDKKPIETDSYKKAVEIASTFKEITLLHKNQIEIDRIYQVETQTEIREVSLPFHLEYLFFFLSAWDRKSNSYTLDIPNQLLTELLKR